MTAMKHFPSSVSTGSPVKFDHLDHRICLGAVDFDRTEISGRQRRIVAGPARQCCPEVDVQYALVTSAVGAGRPERQFLEVGDERCDPVRSSVLIFLLLCYLFKSDLVY